MSEIDKERDFVTWKSMLASSVISLGQAELHLWSVSVSSLASEVYFFKSQILNSIELQAASRFVFQDCRIRYIVAHAALRMILAQYVEEDAKSIIFHRLDKGKPILEGTDVQFNLSHSGDRVLVAVTRGVDVGVDVESLDRHVDSLTLAERFFCKQEYDYLAKKSDGHRRACFFNLWVLKEAFIKAVGEGLSLSLQSFAFGQVDGARPRLLFCPDLYGHPAEWSLSFVNVGSEYRAAWACQYKIEKIRYFHG